MDVSTWTVDQRMRLPDWCFGNREIYGIHLIVDVAAGKGWGICPLALPDPMCVWSLGFFFMTQAATIVALRVGIRATVPTSTGEMDAATAIFPYFGKLTFTPPQFALRTEYSNALVVPCRKGMVTGELFFVAELYADVAATHCDVFMIVSGLPTSMAGWLAHNK